MVRATQPLPRHVRIGVAWRGHLLHEEILDRRVPVRIGTRPDMTVQLSRTQCPEAPEALDLLLLHAGRYWLPLPADPTAHVHLRGVTALPPPELHAGQPMLLVDDLPGGSLQLGELTLLFQFVAADVAPLVTHEAVVLRLGLVHDERLISDRLFESGKRISVGWQRNLDIVLPDDDYRGAPLAFTRTRAGAYALEAPQGQDLRLAVAGTPLDAADLLAKGLATARHGVLTCPLPVGARGRVTLGAHTLLFQVVRQSVTVPARPRQPWQQRLAAPFVREPVWTTSLLMAVVLIGAVVGQALVYQRKVACYGTDLIPEELADNHTIEIAIPTLDNPPLSADPDLQPEPTDAPPQPQPTAHTAPHKAPADAHSGRTQPQTPGDDAPRNARALAGTVAAALQDHNGAAIKVFQDDPNAEARQAQAFGEAPSDEVGGPGHGGLQLEGTPQAGRTAERIIARHASLGPRDPDVIRTVPAAPHKEPTIRLQPPEGPDDDAGDKTQIARKIAGRAKQVKACYEAALRDDPSVGGKIRVSFTVGTAGTITQVQIAGAQSALAQCIEAKFLAIRGLPILTEPRPYNQTFLLENN